MSKLIVSNWLVSLLFACLSMAARDSSNNDSDDVREYCIMETFQPRCSHGEVISMTSASFGRMRVGRCITSDAIKLQQLEPGSLGCSADVLGYFDSVCSGKSACDVSVSNPDLYSYRPCSAQLSMYLETSYTCVSVINDDRSCSISVNVGTPTYVSGSSQSHRQNAKEDNSIRCGSRTNPWIVEAQNGQQINISLLDFGQEQRARSDDEARSKSATAVYIVDRRQNTSCDVQYGYLLDKAAMPSNSRNITICSSSDRRHRNRFIYQSRTSSIEVFFAHGSNTTSHDSSQHRFLIGLEAVGCINLVPPADSWMRRTDNEATIGCYTTRQIWHLRCHEGQWRGTFGQCAEYEHLADPEEPVVQALLMKGSSTFMNTLLIVAVLFIGVAVCLVIIFVGIGWSRRYHNQLGNVKSGEYLSATRTRKHITNTKTALGAFTRTDQNSDAIGTADTQHQYFILDRSITDNDVILNSSA